MESDENDVENKNIEYDSEENEIEIDESEMKSESESEENVQNVVKKATEFFENEAELSESEWGSADEDEKDLDDLEFEQGDADKFDDKKLKSDLERIHM